VEGSAIGSTAVQHNTIGIAVVVQSTFCLRTLGAALTGVIARRGDAKGTRGRNVPVFSPEE
jgi:hypothetical protein